MTASHDTAPATESELSFPRQQARTRRFTLGAPHSFTISPDGARIVFLRTPGPTDSGTCLWCLDPASGSETLIAEPAKLLAGDDEELSARERASRERRRESAAGIVTYAVNDAVTLAAFTLSSRLFVVDLVNSTVEELPARAPVLDPRPDPTGRHVAYVSGGTLRVIGVDGADDRALLEPDGPDVSYGLAEFIAAEEMDRMRGYWWSPDGGRLLAARVDESPVDSWFVAAAATPDAEPARLRYPAAGTPNADVTACVVDLDGRRTDVRWDTAAFPYLASVHWSAGGPPLVTVEDRAQRTLRTLTVDVASGTTASLVTETDPVWVDLLPGSPAWTPDGRLVRIAVRDGRNRLLVDDQVVTGVELHVRAVTSVGDDVVGVSAWRDDPAQPHPYLVELPSAAATEGTRPRVRALTTEPGVVSGLVAGDLLVLSSATLAEPNRRVRVLRIEDEDVRELTEVRSLAATPSLTVNVRLLTVGEHNLSTALLLPRDHVPGQRLPVLLDPYGGPHSQRVLAMQGAYLTSQWFADQGFAVLVTDGRGTPGRDHAWERAVNRDFAGVTLDDQIAALRAVAARNQDLDLSRVAIRGWSYGGYLAALAVLRRPDVFHAAVAGAPVTDWSLYDTHYTERYLGLPDAPAGDGTESGEEIYRRNSLMSGWALPHRALMLIHGLADDNVVFAHTLRLSSALLAAGRPHEVLPLSGVTHMTPQEVVAENLMLLQVDFLRRALGIATEQPDDVG